MLDSSSQSTSMVFTGLPLHHFKVIATDCGTRFDTYSPKGITARSPEKKYTTLTDEELMRLPVGELADPKGCFLMYWETTARAVVGRHIPIMKAWGFRPSALAFTWFKLRKSEPAVPFFLPRQSMHFGAGKTTRKNTEICILGRRGSPKRLNFGIREEIFAPVREHSRKPDEFFERAEQYAEGPYLELFSRSDRAGWVTWGDEKGKYNGQ